jgi:hypothetical protein
MTIPFSTMDSKDSETDSVDKVIHDSIVNHYKSDGSHQVVCMLLSKALKF